MEQTILYLLVALPFLFIIVALIVSLSGMKKKRTEGGIKGKLRKEDKTADEADRPGTGSGLKGDLSGRPRPLKKAADAEFAAKNNLWVCPYCETMNEQSNTCCAACGKRKTGG